jgi:phosphatidylglycerophosphate synthase
MLHPGIANWLSLFRVVAALPTAWMVVQAYWQGAAILLALAMFSDLVDGPLARHTGRDSAAGGLLDHSCDALYVSVVLAALAYTGFLPVLLPLLVALSFLQYVLDSSALSGQALRTSILGRSNGVAYFLILALALFPKLLAPELPPQSWLDLAAWLLIGSTGLSMLDRLLALLKLWKQK